MQRSASDSTLASLTTCLLMLLLAAVAALKCSARRHDLVGLRVAQWLARLSIDLHLNLIPVELVFGEAVGRCYLPLRTSFSS